MAWRSHTWLVARLVLRPIHDMSAVAQRVSECDLTARARKSSEDELGKLAESLNRIGENLAARCPACRA